MTFLSHLDVLTTTGHSEPTRSATALALTRQLGNWRLPRLLLSMRSVCTLVTLALVLLPGTISKAIRRPWRRPDGTLRVKLFFDVFIAPAKVHFAGWPARAGPVGRGM